MRTSILLLATCALAFGDTLVVPNSQANSPGNMAFPLGATAQRFQEVVGGGQFTGPLVITGIHLRSAVGKGRVSFNYASWKVTLSTTQAYPNTSNGHVPPSLSYANNVGPDAATVYDAAHSGSSPGCSGSAPCPFDLAIPFTAPFSFDPTKGRLLVDIVTSAASGIPSGSLDGVGFPDTTSSTVIVVSGDPTQAAGTLNVGGLVLGLDSGITGPVISSVVNAASGIAAGLPNSGIAQGSIFLVVGSNLGPPAISIASSAFQNTVLSGTSISVTVNGTTVAPLLYYTSVGQVAALLPSNTPVGKGTITVTYNGQTSSQAAITVVSSNLGVFTVTSDGQGAGIVTNADYSLVSVTKASNCGGPYTTCGAANPGNTLILWATGLGPVSGSDAAGAGLGVNMPNIPLKLWLGGVQATVVYQGRSGCCVGEDQIVFVVPSNVPTGCSVPLAVQIGNQISNYTVLAVASSGSHTCTATNPIYSSDTVQQLTTSNQPFTYGQVDVSRQPNYNTQGQLTGNNDTGKAQFISFTVPAADQPFIVSYLDPVPPGTCAVYNSLNPSGGGAYLNSIKALNAGVSIKVVGPSGSQTIPSNGGRVTLAAGTFLSPGSYTASGTGGADVSAFSAPFTIPTPPTLTSPASGSSISLSRSSGLTLTWSGGGSNSYIEIDGESATDNTNSNGASFSCFVLANAGTFTIPPSVLLALPPGPGGLDFKPSIFPAAFPATGLSIASVSSSYDAPIFATLQ